MKEEKQTEGVKKTQKVYAIPAIFCGIFLLFLAPLFFFTWISANQNKIKVSSSNVSVEPSVPALIRPKISLGVRLPLSGLDRWVAIARALSPSLRKDVHFFFSVWDDAPPPSFELAAPLFDGHDVGRGTLLGSMRYEPNETSFNTGRNKLARAMYASELKMGYTYDAWVFFDNDAIFINCEGCPRSVLPNMTGPACCAEALIDVMRPGPKSLGWATLGYWTALLDNSNVPKGRWDDYFVDFDSQWTSPDMKFTAIAREAVEVLLPWDSSRDGINWHDAHMYFWFYLQACLPGYNAVSGRNIYPLDESVAGYGKMVKDTRIPAGQVDWMRHFEFSDPGLMKALNITSVQQMPFAHSPPPGFLTRPYPSRPAFTTRFTDTPQFAVCKAFRASKSIAFLKGDIGEPFQE